jgi:hypothetical protein
VRRLLCGLTSDGLKPGAYNDVEKQVAVTVNQAGQQGRAAQADNLDASRRVSLNPRRWSSLFDLAVLNQNGCGLKHIPGSRIE